MSQGQAVGHLCCEGTDISIALVLPLAVFFA